MKIKKIITAILLLATCLTVTSCGPNYNEYEVGDLVYSIDNPDTENASAFVYELSESGKNKDVVYIPDEVDGMPVIGVGKIRMAIAQVSTFSSPNLGKIYFPWSIESVAVSYNWGSSATDQIYVICPSTECFLDQSDGSNLYIVPLYSYNNGYRNAGSITYKKRCSRPIFLISSTIKVTRITGISSSIYSRIPVN